MTAIMLQGPPRDRKLKPGWRSHFVNKLQRKMSFSFELYLSCIYMQVFSTSGRTVVASHDIQFVQLTHEAHCKLEKAPNTAPANVQIIQCMPCHRGGISWHLSHCFCPLSTKIFGGKTATEGCYTWPFRCYLLKAGPDQDFVNLFLLILTPLIRLGGRDQFARRASFGCTPTRIPCNQPRWQGMSALPPQTSLTNMCTYFRPWPKHRCNQGCATHWS